MASSTLQATGLYSLANEVNPILAASSGIDPPPAIGSITIIDSPQSSLADFSILSKSSSRIPFIKARLQLNPISIWVPGGFVSSICLTKTNSSPDLPNPISRSKSSLGKAAGNIEPNIAALAAVNGRRAHQTCSLLSGGCCPVERSLLHSTPMAAAGSQSSINTLGRLFMLLPRL